MALLQISEPGDSPEPHQRKLAVGIDLGTTHSLAATVRSGAAEVIGDEQAKFVVIAAGDDGHLVEQTAGEGSSWRLGKNGAVDEWIHGTGLCQSQG